METKEHYDDYGLDGVKKYANSIKRAAALIGLPPEAIAGALAEEYEVKDIVSNASTLAILQAVKDVIDDLYNLSIKD